MAIDEVQPNSGESAVSIAAANWRCSPMREYVVPLLAEALSDEPATYETRLTAAAGAVEAHASLLTEP